MANSADRDHTVTPEIASTIVCITSLLDRLLKCLGKGLW